MMKRNRDISNVGDALKKMLGAYSLNKKFDQTELISSWERIVGSPIANRTEKIFVKNDVLFVEISSAPLKSELNMSKSRILEKIEEELGSSTIQNIIFL